ncbi:MAG TPA: hypothetical protein GXX55_07680 [Firmicutes bacterium]|nr:hypothetical protein [Bacillota bacterium]
MVLIVLLVFAVIDLVVVPVVLFVFAVIGLAVVFGAIPVAVLIMIAPEFVVPGIAWASSPAMVVVIVLPTGPIGIARATAGARVTATVVVPTAALTASTSVLGPAPGLARHFDAGFTGG